ncbi:MAG: hypothetical protein JNM31_00830 [Flavobacteriales bacterium]|nr:hypothetical protein [Flavobacteriales bacterium]
MADTVTIVLSDTLSIRFRGEKPSNCNVFFERHMVVRYGNEADVARYAHVVIPESLDPPYDRRGKAWGAWTGFEGGDWSDVRLDFLHVRKVWPDGMWQDVPWIARQRSDTVRSLRATDRIDRQRFELQNVDPGDVVEFHYKYMVPYDMSWPHSLGWRQHEWAGNWQRLTSWRVFFHRDIPVLQQFVEVIYRRHQGLLLTGAKPSAVEEDGVDVRQVFVNYDLPGCMDEVNARPASELPHLILSLDLFDSRNFMRDRLSNQPLPTPYWANVIRWRERRADWWRRVAKKSMPDRQNQLLKEFVHHHSAGIPANQPLARLAALQEVIANAFTVRSSDLWFADLDQSLDRMGEQLAKGELKEHSLYDLYAKLLAELDLGYLTIYPLDKRLGRLSPSYLTPLWESLFGFVVLGHEGDLIVMPPGLESSYLPGELPFYWQQATALKCEINAMYSLVVPSPTLVTLPDLGQVDLRRTELHVRVDPLLGAATAHARVYHSGQFSTLCRNAYLRSRSDPTIERSYGHRLFDAGQVRLQNLVADPPAAWPPYGQVVNMDLDLTPGLMRSDDTLWILDLSRILIHALPDGFHAPTRDLPFHWDFAQDDRITIVLDVPKELEPVVVGPVDWEWRCASALYRFRTEKHPDGTFRLTSQLIIHDDAEPVSGRYQLAELLAAASKIEALKVHFRMVPPRVDGR